MIKTEDVLLKTEEDGNQVLSAMRDLLNAYEQVTLADFLELVGVMSSYGDNLVGWTDLKDVKVKSVSEGFILDLPEAKEFVG